MNRIEQDIITETGAAVKYGTIRETAIVINFGRTMIPFRAVANVNDM